MFRFATGKDKGRRVVVTTQAEFFALLTSLRTPTLMALHDVVQKAVDNYQVRPGYRALLKECAKNSPIAGIMPIAGNVECRRVLESIAEGKNCYTRSVIILYVML